MLIVCSVSFVVGIISSSVMLRDSSGINSSVVFVIGIVSFSSGGISSSTISSIGVSVGSGGSSSSVIISSSITSSSGNSSVVFSGMCSWDLPLPFELSVTFPVSWLLESKLS